MQGVVYCTQSVHAGENEGVVTRAIESVNLMGQRRVQFSVAPPVLPMSDVNIKQQDPLSGKYLRYAASNMMSGCFVATIIKEVMTTLTIGYSDSRDVRACKFACKVPFLI